VSAQIGFFELTAILAKSCQAFANFHPQLSSPPREEIEAVYMYVEKAKRKEMYKYKAPTIAACRDERGSGAAEIHRGRTKLSRKE